MHLFRYVLLFRTCEQGVAAANSPGMLYSIKCLPTHTVGKLESWCLQMSHDDVIKWKYFPVCWSFVRGIVRPPVDSPHKGQWRSALMYFFISVWIHGWAKQWRSRWFETPSRSLWRHCNASSYLTCPSAGTLLSTHTRHYRNSLVIKDFEYVIADHTISFNMADKISLNIAELWGFI